MDKRTLTALQGSIAKWEAIVNGTGVDNGIENCPLCQIFMLGDDVEEACEGCPVFEATALESCDGSPYEAWSDYHHDVFNRFTSKDELRVYENEPETLAMAKAELDFLRSLLPADAKGEA